MEFKDQRLKLMNDVLSGIKVLKLYAWEPSMQRMIADLRSKELRNLRGAFLAENFANVMFQLGPIAVSIVYSQQMHGEIRMRLPA